ncbi:MAG TPA: hypothetical protein PKO09_18325 [Anaerolineae bacterium]|nr:hypothetical protein [Anaerolineae bacterium]
MKKRSRWTLLVVAGALVLALALGLALGQRPQAQEADPAEPVISSAGPGYVFQERQSPEPEDEINATVSIRVAGSMLRPREDNVSYNWGSSGGCIYATTGDDYTIWNAPVYLPLGSTVTQMRMYVNDTSTLNTSGFFSVYDLYGDLVDEWAVTSSGTPGEAYYVVNIDPGHVIDYEVYSYAVNWRPNDTGNDLQLCGFRLLYTPPPGAVFLPSVMRDNSP